MKIKNSKDVEILNRKIKNDLGIEIQKYRNEEVVSDFVDLLIFPKYALNWTIRPVINEEF